MERDHKIDKINAYRKLLKTRKLPSFDKDADKNVSCAINEEFDAWVNNQIASLLGEGSSQNGGHFSEDEIAILKAMVTRVQTKAQTPQPEQPIAQRPQPSRITKPEGAKFKTSPRKAPEGSLLAELEKMDSEGPEY